jgi:hypothetical protein
MHLSVGNAFASRKAAVFKHVVGIRIQGPIGAFKGGRNLKILSYIG